MTKSSSRIVILGWGSLLWDVDSEKGKDFEEKCCGKWHDSGPELPIEFSRISSSRNNALTLVIDDTDGTKTQVAYRYSKRSDIDQAVADLSCREGAMLKKIGFVDVRNNNRQCCDSATCEQIKTWAKSKEINAVIWTALGGNFNKKKKQDFSVDNALLHLRALDDIGKCKAAEYFAKAPCFVKTGLRTDVEKEDWYKKLVGEHKFECWKWSTS
ncbi:conserved hypothetical protein [Rhodospirillaceae bacterium LM-1]|nr:conserved hypothetical protein [Rhodospirillaceae bacterium LM-1]